MFDWSDPHPEAPVYVVGDIHGSADHLSRLLERIDRDVAATGVAGAELVFVGDYIDRGEESAAVLRFLSGLTAGFGAHVTCLAGNHEQMLLSFLHDPMGRAKRWLRHGGAQTLASFGVAPPAVLDNPPAAELVDAAGDLREAMGPALVDWLAALPTWWRSGNLWAVHAGADPARPMGRQDEATLLWGHESFFEIERTDGQWVCVGHQPVEQPFASRGRIAVDTGAVYGGRLTALRAVPGERLAFLQS